ncbi:methyltransferase domain-containing protein [Neobacillus cucumis]|uniref:class I SAM-dependent methyltransferase n=1 Tax=Neobacillus cucumis TaxID=1740721 RepID=UPI0018DF9EA5|nr:class I SAM-dependent methyltransferase [Neobacillus cucumis]MBI0576056.1 methyltransferase domain-containing protein [Neobacillus cucumis]
MQWVDEAEKQWDNRADSWHSSSRGMWETGSRKDIIPFLKKYLPDESAICDLGCGDGYASVMLARMGYHVTGIDLSEQMLEKASVLAKGRSVQFIKADISEVPLESNSLDAVMAINSLEWTESPLKVLFEIKRIVKKDGLACIAILGPTAMPRINSFPRLYGEKVICNTMMPWEFEKLAEENGFKKIAEMGVYKREAEKLPVENLPLELRQSLSFMWVFMFKIK